MDIVLDFSGWCKLSEDTKMQRFTDNESLPASITVREWANLPSEHRNEYLLEDAVAAIRDSEDMEFIELTLSELDPEEC